MPKTTHCRIWTAGLAFALSTACATVVQAQSDASAPVEVIRPKGPKARPNVLTRDEIQQIDAGATALDAVRRLRPEFLSRRVAPMPADPYGGFPAVYVDGVRLGELGMLQSIPVSAVVEIRYLRASAAAHELGALHRGGVLVVSTRR